MNMYSVHKPVHRIEHSPQIGRIWDRIWNLELYPDIFTKTGTWNREELGVEMEFQKKTLGIRNENQTSSYVFTNFHSRVQFLTF